MLPRQGADVHAAKPPRHDAKDPAALPRRGANVPVAKPRQDASVGCQAKAVGQLLPD